MRLSEICIERPVFTTVLSLVIVLVGALALLRLPNRELPDVDPPVVMVTTIFQGASAEVVERHEAPEAPGAANVPVMDGVLIIIRHSLVGYVWPVVLFLYWMSLCVYVYVCMYCACV